MVQYVYDSYINTASKEVSLPPKHTIWENMVAAKNKGPKSERPGAGVCRVMLSKQIHQVTESGYTSSESQCIPGPGIMILA